MALSHNPEVERSALGKFGFGREDSGKVGNVSLRAFFDAHCLHDSFSERELASFL